MFTIEKIANIIKNKRVLITCRQRFFKMEKVLLNVTNGTQDEIVTNLFSPGKNSNFLGISPLKNEIINENRPFRVSVEGNIGAGKSTCIEYFKKFNTIETYTEPIEWWRNLNGENLLDLLYTDINKWISIFQSYVQLTRLKIQTKKPENDQIKVQMYERSLQNNRFCFLEHAYRKGSLTSADYAVLDLWYRWIRENIDINLDLIVYLRTTPEIVYERVKKRNRPEEINLNLNYLKDLHDSHEKWLMSNDERFNTIPIIVLDGNQDINEMVKQYKLYEDEIFGKIKKGIKRMDNNDLNKVKKNLKIE